MNDKLIKSSKNGKLVTKTCMCMDTDATARVLCDDGISYEYLRQLGSSKTWVAGGQRIFCTEADMTQFVEYFNATGDVSQYRPATQAQIKYLITLGVTIEAGMTVDRASQLISFAKSDDGVGCVSGSLRDGSI